MNQKLFACLMLVVCLSAGCTKDDPIYHGKIRNTLNQSVHISLYNNSTDYYANENAVWSADIVAKGDVVVPKELEGGKEYYYDWYSSDYLNTNWPYNIQLNMANITPDMDPLMTIRENAGYGRVVCLNSTQVLSAWRAYDATVSSSSSVWSSLSSNEQYREIVFRKDLTGTYTFKDNTGNTHDMDFTYNPIFNGGSFPLNIFVVFGNQGNSYSVYTPYGNGSFGVQTDTIMIDYFPQMNYQYKFIRK